MTVALLNALSLWGTQSTLIRVEVHLSGGLPTFKIVGMSSHAAQATTERVRAAINSCGYTFPVGRLTVNLSPSDVPKHTAGTDLAIAVGILLATQQVSFNASQTGSPVRQAYEPKAWVFLGELSLSGTLLDVSHLLPMLLTLAKDHPHACVMLPRQQLHHLPHLPNLNIMGVSTLNEACQVLTGKTQAVWFKQTVDLNHLKNPILDLCLSDVRGQGEAVRALEIAAAGGHHLLLAGSAGAGKSLLAKRLVSLLPELNAQAALEVAAIQCFASPNPQVNWGRPVRSPHSRTTLVAMTGGGVYAMPGEVTFAHHGVLILDEAAEFERSVLDALREPIETGVVHVSRLKARLSHPAAFQLVMTTNLCPCGWFGHPSHACRCQSTIRERYQRALSGPLLDRIDLALTLHAPTHAWQLQPKAPPSTVVRQRVARAQKRAINRQGCLNRVLQLPQIESLRLIDDAVWGILNRATQRLALSTRSQLKALRVAITCADLDQAINTSQDHVTHVGVEHISEALGYRLHTTGKKIL